MSNKNDQEVYEGFGERKQPAVTPLPQAGFSATTNAENYDTNVFVRLEFGFKELFRLNQKMSVILLVAGGISLIFGFFQNIGPSFVSTILGDNSSSETAIGAIVVVLIFSISLILGLIYFFIDLMAYVTAVKTLENTTILPGDAGKEALKLFLPALGYTILTGFMIFFGFLFFIIPGIFLAVVFSLGIPLMVYKKIGPIEAIGQALRIGKTRFVELYAIAFFAGMIGSFTCGVTSLVAKTAMYSSILADFTYRDDNNIQKPQLHWSNWLAVGISLFFILILLVIVIAIIPIILLGLAPLSASS